MVIRSCLQVVWRFEEGLILEGLHMSQVSQPYLIYAPKLPERINLSHAQTNLSELGAHSCEGNTTRFVLHAIVVS